jgi:hypothetical protein
MKTKLILVFRKKYTIFYKILYMLCPNFYIITTKIDFESQLHKIKLSHV